MKKFLSCLFVLALILGGAYLVYKYIINVEPPVIDPDNPVGNTNHKLKTETFTVNGVSFKMILVEGGTFTMGATAEQGGDAEKKEYPNHKVTLSSFCIGETEVTEGLWAAVMGRQPRVAITEENPKSSVSRSEINQFIEKLNHLTGRNFRLPTEAEWEFAARGGKKSKGYGNMSKGFKYSGSEDINKVAWYAHHDYKMHHVASLLPNELGIYDMSGNVYELCQDWYGDYSSTAQNNPRGAQSGSSYVIRGGCYSSGPEQCRVTWRSSAGRGFAQLGFRLAM